MNIKIIISVILLVIIVATAVFSFGIKELMIENLAQESTGQNCNDGFCTTCIINEMPCSCNTEICECGELVVNSSSCQL